MTFNNTSECLVVTTPEYSAEILEAVNVYLLTVQGIVVGGIGIIGAILTISLMIVILANKDLHTRTFIICLQLLALDLMFIVFIHCSIFVTSMARKWVFGSVWCRITGAVSYLAIYWRCSILFVLTLDRFLIVFYSFSYCKIAKKVLVVTSIVFFVFFFTLVIIPAFETGCYEFSDTALFCQQRQM